MTSHFQGNLLNNLANRRDDRKSTRPHLHHLREHPENSDPFINDDYFLFKLASEISFIFRLTKVKTEQHLISFLHRRYHYLL